MTDASPSSTVRRVLFLTLIATAVATIPGSAGVLARHAVLQAAAAAALFCTFFAGRVPGVLRTGWPLLALAVPACLSTLLSLDPERSLLGSPLHGGGLVGTLAVVGIALAVSLKADDALPQMRVLLAGLIWALAGFAVLQRLGWNPLADRAASQAGAFRGASSTAVAFGGFLALATPIVHEGAFKPSESPTRRKIYAATPLAAFVGIFIADVRGPLVALAAGLWALNVMKALAGRRHTRAKILLVAGAIGITTCLAMVRGGPSQPSFLLHGEVEAGNGRDELHAESLRAMREADARSLVFGRGLETTRFISPRRTPEPSLANDELDVSYERARSLMHETLMTGGWLGIVGFTMLVAFLLVHGTKQAGLTRLGPPATLVGYVVYRLFAATTPETELLFAIAAGFLLRPSKNGVAGDLGAVGRYRADAGFVTAVALSAALIGAVVASSTTGATSLALWGAAFLLCVVGRPEPLRVAAAAAVLAVFLAWRPALARVAARDDVRTAATAARIDGTDGVDFSKRYAAGVAADDGARGFELTAAAVVTSRLGDDDAAAALAERAAHRDPLDGAAKALSARLYGRLPASGAAEPARFAEARARYERAIAVWDDDSGLRLEQIRLLLVAGDRAAADAALAAFAARAETIARRRDAGLLERYSADLAAARTAVERR